MTKNYHAGDVTIELNNKRYRIDFTAPIPCARCEAATLTKLKGARHVCYGHGSDQAPYIQFWDDSVLEGQDALTVIEVLKKQRG